MQTVTVKDVTLGEGAVKVIVPITGTTTELLVEQAARLAEHDLDLVEWRVDHFEQVSDTGQVLDAARRIADALGGKPVLFTFRTAAEGGLQAITPEDYAELNIAVARSGLVDLVDVELYLDREQGDRVIAAAHEAGVKVVVSNHDFEATPPREEIVARLRAMQDRGADIPKIALMPRDPGDVLTLLAATYEMASQHADRPILTMAMAGPGVISRMAGEVFGSCATFAMVGQASAPGQVPVEELQPVLRLLHENL